MTTTHLLEQLTQLSDSLKQTNTLITRLAKLSFQPGSEPLDTTDSNTVRIELAQDIHDALKQLEEDLELLKQDADDFTSLPNSASGHKRRESKTGEKERERARVSAQITRLSEDLRDLFAGRSQLKQKRKDLNQDEQLVGATTDVTAALRRTHNLLSTELSRSRFAQETFDQSTAALSDLGEHYTGLESILSNSKNLLGTLLRSQKSDTWYLETAFYLLIATLAWLFFRRILYGPFIKLPLFLWHSGAFLLRWAVFKPLWGLAVLTGVVTTSTATAGGSTGITRSYDTSTRAPLIIQPSAKGGPPVFAMSEREQLEKGGGVPVGAGGAGAKVGKDPESEKRVSEGIAEMHERSERAKRGGVEEREDDGVQRRGDGTVLKARGDVPRNPKKKMFEADVEDERQRARERDEL
ncbi:Protein transport protein sec20 [Rachicladosporium monterosium]|uniref:Protein transport protein sec20 n=1 Tax=Rachicladosporium monterosium TaxID=1507873 RepID=A0ABR0L6H1_9PEZI|nr:Protein transport protein sec20 [Rachicladosporium monterosium]